MELVNHTPVTADLRLSYLSERSPNRRGYLTAKATFNVVGGRAELDRNSPFEVFTEMQDHPLGCIPQDVMVIERDPFEVMLLAEVVAPEGETLTQTTVEMSVGGQTRTLAVFGDRAWDGDVISEPLPFERMPLTWERAYGGSGQIEIDEGAFLDVCDPINVLGRGVDLSAHAEALARELVLPPGYPRFDSERRLPNLEDPRALIVDPSDKPRPVCWAPVPLEVGARFSPALDGIDRDALKQTERTNALEESAMRELIVSNLRHAHPDWWIPRPARGASITLKGVLAEGDLSFDLPALRVFGDYVVGPRRGTRELVPQCLVLFANERRLCITYRTSFKLRFVIGQERCFRLRTEEGWYEGAAKGAGHG